MAENAREVFQFFVENRPEGAPYEVGLLAYAQFERERYEWIAHVERRTGRTPDTAEVDEWIASLPPERLDRIRDQALQLFGLVAADFMQEEIERQRREAVERSILTEIKGYTSGARAFLKNVAAGVVAAFLFALLLLLFYVLAVNDPSPIELGRRLTGDSTAGPPATQQD